MYITFIFKLPNGPKAYNTYYGKYHTDHILPEHEGLDEVIKPYLLKGINEYYKFELKQRLANPLHITEFKEKVPIGIMSVSNDTDISIHSSNEEKHVFDFFCQNFTIDHKISLEMYVFGKLIENAEF